MMTSIASNDIANSIPDIRLVGVGGAGIGILSQIYSTTKDVSSIAMDSSKGCVESAQWVSVVSDVLLRRLALLQHMPVYPRKVSTRQLLQHLENCANYLGYSRIFITQCLASLR